MAGLLHDSLMQCLQLHRYMESAKPSPSADSACASIKPQKFVLTAQALQLGLNCRAFLLQAVWSWL